MKKQKPGAGLPSPEKALSAELKAMVDLVISRYKMEKIVCFGSITNNIEYHSCFTEYTGSEGNPWPQNSYSLLLIPSAQEIMADIVIQMQAEESLKHIAQANILVHRMEEINNALMNGSSFFTTIYKKGTLLYDQGKELFVAPAAGEAISKRILKRELFWQQWYKLSDGFLKGAVFYKRGELKNLSVYMLYQALLHCYSGMLRVLTGYRTNTNGLRRLMRLVDHILPESSFAGGLKTPEDGRLTALLLKGIGEARYDETFQISDYELSLIIRRVEEILSKGNIACLQHIEEIKGGVRPCTS
ncbi:HEPN domain-containing protein [Pedobacter deserti]|uniref:HEPN domain-containing protein n=1 Tax=Pedobacter deserti TaxID=2817382 RepID=UPI00210E41A0|nr:HEPN domain-containing protein [Pedobacter sp. SYSU D00382]